MTLCLLNKNGIEFVWNQHCTLQGKLNPANCAVWHCRRQCLDEMINNDNMSTVLKQDLELGATLGGANPKNKKIRCHHRVPLEMAAKQQSGDGDGEKGCVVCVTDELQCVAKVLEAERKNCHAWSHMQLIVRTVNDATLWEKELGFGTHFCQVRNPFF